MKILPPKRWMDIAPGDVVMIGSVPRTVLLNSVIGDWYRLVYLEGLPRPMQLPIYGEDYATVVELDTGDAVGTLFAAGLNPQPIGEAS